MDHLVVQIEPEDVKTTSRQVGKEGNKRTLNEQRGYIYKDTSKYPLPIRFTLPDNAPAYQAGKYFIKPESFVIDRYGSLGMGFALYLEPISGEMKKAS